MTGGRRAGSATPSDPGKHAQSHARPRGPAAKKESARGAGPLHNTERHELFLWSDENEHSCIHLRKEAASLGCESLELP